MHPSEWRLPAEWEPQDAVLLAWPHAGTDWAGRLGEVESTYASLVAAITRFETAVVCVPDTAAGTQVAARCAAAGANPARLRTIAIPYDDTWLRDSGPLILKSPGGHASAARPGLEPIPGKSGDPPSAGPAAEAPQRFVLADFHFTGWGGRFEGPRDDALIAGLVARRLFRADASHRRFDWALEGGAIESDGEGTLLTTWRCLHQRHPDESRDAIERTLRTTLAAQRILWLDHGHLEGDDTDAHIDTLARFAPDGAIVFQACDDARDSHHGELASMRRELEALRTGAGKRYRLFPLPWPKAIVDHGRRLAASYANYLVANDAVLVPAYADAADDAAAEIIGAAHPGREVVQVPCRPLIWQNGSLHCVTMQVPAGALA